MGKFSDRELVLLQCDVMQHDTHYLHVQLSEWAVDRSSEYWLLSEGLKLLCILLYDYAVKLEIRLESAESQFLKQILTIDSNTENKHQSDGSSMCQRH